MRFRCCIMQIELGPYSVHSSSRCLKSDRHVIRSQLCRKNAAPFLCGVNNVRQCLPLLC